VLALLPARLSVAAADAIACDCQQSRHDGHWCGHRCSRWPATVMATQQGMHFGNVKPGATGFDIGVLGVEAGRGLLATLNRGTAKLIGNRELALAA
jgi:hypothetical protein